VTRWVFHVDLDEFIAAVEILRRPELEGRPVVVGGDGDPTKRGVVSTANYVARRYGVGSAMPLRTAFKGCPEAVFLPVDEEAYFAASRKVMHVLGSFPGVVQPMGWDEAFMGVRADDPEAVAQLIQSRVFERTQLWCSIGIGDTRLRAKLASGFAKPRGVFRLTRHEWFDVMGAQPTEELWGIGTKTARKLADLGIRTVEQLAAADDSMMADVFGPKTGPWIRQLGTGEGSDRVTSEPHVARGVSREHTFQVDVADPDEVRQEMTKLAHELIEDVRKDGRSVARVGVKVRFRPFITKTRSVTLPAPTTDEDGLTRGAHAALAKLELSRPVRLIGVRAEFAA
jgi:DNA polymerase IV